MIDGSPDAAAYTTAPSRKSNSDPHAVPTLNPVVESYFDAEAADHPIAPLRLTQAIRARLDQPEPQVALLSTAIHLAAVESDDGVSAIRDKAERNVTNERVRSTKVSTATGIYDSVIVRDAELQEALDQALAKRSEHNEIDAVERPRLDSDGKKRRYSTSQLWQLRLDQIVFAGMLGCEGVVATAQVKGSFLPAGDHWWTAAAMGIPCVLSYFYALRARPLDLQPHQLPTFNSLLTRRGLQLAVLVIVMFAVLLGESTGTTNIFSGSSGNSGGWKQFIFTGALMLSLGIAAKNIFRLVREQKAVLVEFAPTPNLQYSYWQQLVAAIRQTRLANSAIANEMQTIKDRIAAEAVRNADFEEGEHQKQVAMVKGARAAGASQTAERISELFSRN